MGTMDGKIDGGILSIALLLIIGRTRATRLQINPTSISIGIIGCLQRLLDGIINCKPGNFARFNSCITAAPSLLTGDAITKINPVSAVLIGNTISGNRSMNNFPACTQIRGVYSRLPDVISLVYETVRVGTAMFKKAVHNKFIYSINTVIINQEGHSK